MCCERTLSSLEDLLNFMGGGTGEQEGSYPIAHFYRAMLCIRSGGFKGAKGLCPPRCQRWHLNNPSTAKSRQLLGTSSPRPPTGPPPLDPAGDLLNWPPPSSFSASAPVHPRYYSHGPISVCLSHVGVVIKRLYVGSHKEHFTIAQGL